ncbi:hypothetical protein GC174_05240 [bacterium]|nr:hypothetical protein [bacterium]
MAADQVQEKPKEADANASDSAAGKPAEAPKNEVKEAEQGANDKMQQEVSGTAAQNSSDAGSQDVAETNKVNDGAEATSETAQSTREKLSVEANLTSPEANKAAAESQIKFDPNKTILSSVNLDSFSNLAAPETKAEPTEKVIDGVKAFELTGKSRLAEGETKKYDDLKIMHDGKVLLDFDDADIIQNQWSANIKLDLPDTAKTETIDGAGTRSLIQDKDGGTTEVIKAEDGTVYIRQGEQYYMAKTGFYGQVIEGKEAKEAFEAKSEEFGAGAKVMNHSAVSATNAISIQQKDGTELVSVDKDGKVETKIPGDAFIIGGADGQRAILTDGTQMVKSDKGTTILNSDGRVIQVGVDGKVQEFARGDAAGQAAWKAEASRFETNVKPTGTDGAFSFSDTFNISDWLYTGTDTKFSFSDFSFDNFDWDDTSYLMSDPFFGEDFKEFALKDLTCKADPNFDLSNMDLNDFIYDKAYKFSDEKATALETSALEKNGKDVSSDEARSVLSERLSQVTLQDGTQASFDMMKVASQGLQGPDIIQKRDGAQIAQYDTETGLKRIYNEKTGEVTLSYQDDNNPKNSFVMEAQRDADGKLINARAIFSDSVISKDGEKFSYAMFEGKPAPDSQENRLKNGKLENSENLTADQAKGALEGRFSRLTLKDGSHPSFDPNVLIDKGLTGDGIENSKNEEKHQIGQHDPRTGITRIENTQTGEITLSYIDENNPENSFYMEAHRGPDGKIERSKTAFNDGVVIKEGDNFSKAVFADRTEVRSGDAVSIRLKGQNATFHSLFGDKIPDRASVETEDGSFRRNGDFAAGRDLDGRFRVFSRELHDRMRRRQGNPHGERRPGAAEQGEVSPSASLEGGVRSEAEADASPNSTDRGAVYDPRTNTLVLLDNDGKEGERISIEEAGLQMRTVGDSTVFIDPKTNQEIFRVQANGDIESLNAAGLVDGRVSIVAPGVIRSESIDTRPQSADDPTAGSRITNQTDFNTGKATQTVNDGDGSVKFNADIDLATGNRVDRDANGNITDTFSFQNGQVAYGSADFNKTLNFTVTNDNGDVYHNDGSITDAFGSSIFDSATGSFNADAGWSSSGYSPYGYSSPEQMALEARAESEAQTASGLAAAVASKVAAAVATGNVSVVMSSLGEIAGAYAAISAAQGIAIQAGDTALAGMLSLQTSQVNAAAGQVVATIVNVQENNRVGGPMEGDSALAKGLTSLTYSISNPLMKRAQILHGMGRDDDPIVKQLLGKDTENA